MAAPTAKPGNSIHNGYPPEHTQAIRSAWRSTWLILAVTGAAAVLLGAAAMFLDSPVLLAALAGAVFLLALVGSTTGVWSTYRHVRIIPFYQRGVGNTDTFLYGQAIARHFQALEALAAAAGVRPLSRFGFPDPLAGHLVVWHAPEDALRTVHTLLEELDHHPSEFEDPDAVRADLLRWKDALTRAAEQEIGFSLLILHGDTTSSLEWERRGGSPF